MCAYTSSDFNLKIVSDSFNHYFLSIDYDAVEFVLLNPIQKWKTLIVKPIRVL